MSSLLNVDRIAPVNPSNPVNFVGTFPPTHLTIPLLLAFPLTPSGDPQLNLKITAGTGVPNNLQGSDGWIFLRSDGGAGTTIYHKRLGVWVGIV